MVVRSLLLLTDRNLISNQPNYTIILLTNLTRTYSVRFKFTNKESAAKEKALIMLIQLKVGLQNSIKH